MSVTSPVELPQLFQLSEKLIDHDRIATLALLVRQRSCLIRGTPGRTQRGPKQMVAPLGVAQGSHSPWRCYVHLTLTFDRRPGESYSPRADQMALQMALAHALHFEASTAFGSLQKGQVLTSAGGGSLMNIREIHQTTNAMTMNVMIELMNRP